MKKNDLKHTKKRLTIIFTLIILFVAIFLEFIFFTGKYINYKSIELYKFNNLTKTVENKKFDIKHIIKNFDIRNRLFKMNHKNILGDGDLNNDDQFINLLVVNKQTKKLVFGNIVNDVRIDLVISILQENEYSQSEEAYGYLIRKIKINEKGVDYDVLFIKKLKYCFGDYLFDLFGFIFVTFIFSILFYYIGYRFVNKNLEPVEQNISDMQDFIHNAGHELKTPITVISSNLQLLNEIKQYDKELINDSLSEIKRLDKLIVGLVELSDINSVSEIEIIKVKGLIKVISSSFKEKLEKADIKLKIKTISDFEIKANEEYFYIFISNLISNAIKYNKKGGKITVTISKNKIIISDTGIGIDKQNLEKIFDRFFQEDKSRNAKGFGIGLSLVKKIADIYKWKIEIKSEKGKGSEFIVNF